MRRYFAALVLVALSACHSKDEARALLTAVDAFRAAPNEDKPAKADALDHIACTDKEICDVKSSCTKSADATAKGLRLQKEVQDGARDSGPYPDDLAVKWKEASADLAEGYGLLEDCRARTQGLRERYGL